ncbi:hypothetical protein DPMN_078778 [Dreissena polymorpha]|uniref:Uncharacterized protein n=1 Tax=Dreissena polymorpha TaxID=45954 RepID=A0A9D3YRV4_DREPO|nr:hypothetical protein DPMN_078778 [Dreissena polymorpha]
MDDAHSEEFDKHLDLTHSTTVPVKSPRETRKPEEPEEEEEDEDRFRFRGPPPNTKRIRSSKIRRQLSQQTTNEDQRARFPDIEWRRNITEKESFDIGLYVLCKSISVAIFS